MHADHAIFLGALESEHQVSITFVDAKDKRERTLTCAPLDFGMLRGSRDQKPRYQVWDMGARRAPFNVTILPDDVRSIVALDATFDPAKIITWAFKPNAWSVARNWREFS
ncbi:hypothetical protein BH11MYX4_BH11MYX4_67220 [soil metagenome]